MGENTNCEGTFSLIGTLEAVSLQREAEDNQLKGKQQVLNELQVTLLDLNKNCETFEFELKNIDRQLSGVLCEIEQIKQHNTGLESHLHEIYSENVKLRLQIKEEEERLQSSQTRYITYRHKMKKHKMAISAAQQHAPGSNDLLKGRELVQNRDTPTIDNVEEEEAMFQLLEIDDLEQQVLAAKRETLEGKQALVPKGREAHALPKKDIELLLQKRRYEAMARRMRRRSSRPPNTFYLPHQTQ